MKDLDLTTLRYFVAACETGNMAAAAAQQHIVPSAVSKRLAQLESDLGVPLLARGRRGVTPTPAGETLLEHARAMLASASRIAQDMAGYGSGVRGHVRLLATVSCIAERLPDDVAAFMKKAQHREIQVDIEEALSRDIVRRVKEGSASVGILWDAANLEGLQFRAYREDHLAVVAHPSHPLAVRRHCSFEETLGFEHVGLQASSAVNMMLDRAAAVAGTKLRYRAVVSNFEAALRVIRAGLGISIIPREVAQAHATALGLKVIALKDPWARRRFAICFRDHGKLPRAAGLLVDYLQAVSEASTRAASPAPTASGSPASRRPAPRRAAPRNR